MKKLIHIAYYNDVEDIKAYANLSADEIVDKAKYNLGNLYLVDKGDCCSPNDFDEGVFNLQAMVSMQ